MKILDIRQGTDEWLQARLGKITGTRLKAVMGGPQAQETLIYELIAEQITGQAEQVWVNDAMRWGTEHEAEAVKEYEKRTKTKTDTVGFCVSDEFPFLGLSPDRLVKPKKNYLGAVEVKCPTTKTFVKYKVEPGIPKDYKWQVVNYFLVCDTLQWLDFVVYDPRVIDKKQCMVCVRVTREELQDDIEEAKRRLSIFHESWHIIYDKVKLI